MNETITAFGYPDTLLKEYKHWVVLLRPKQVTVGSLVLAAKSAATNLGALSQEEWSEFATVTKDSEALLRETFGAEKFNYLALMMVDPNVHFHFIPRYSKSVEIEGNTYSDADWPKKTEMEAVEMDAASFEAIKRKLLAESE